MAKNYTKDQLFKMLEEQANATGLTERGINVLKKIMKVESRWNVKAIPTSGRSNAVGLFQVVPDTWNEWAEKLPDMDKTNSPNGDGRLDPEQQIKFAIAFTKHNVNVLADKLKHEPNDGEIYLAHFLGAETAAKVIETAEKEPSARIDRVLSQKVMKANGYKSDGDKGVSIKLKNGGELLFEDFTVADLVNWANGKMELPEKYHVEGHSYNYKKNAQGEETKVPESFGEMIMSIITGAVQLLASLAKGAVTFVMGDSPSTTPPQVAKAPTSPSTTRGV